VIPARGDLVVRLTYDFTDRVPADFGKLAREFQVTLSLEVIGIPQMPLVASGICRSHLATNTTLLNFGEANIRGREPVPRWLTVTTDDKTTMVRFVPDDNSLRIGAVVQQGNLWRVPITPDQAHIRGDFDTAVRIEALDHSGEIIGTSRVAVTGSVRDSVTQPEENSHVP
jgi:hypothetical protein